jgi:hypothetical protein
VPGGILPVFCKHGGAWLCARVDSRPADLQTCPQNPFSPHVTHPNTTLTDIGMPLPVVWRCGVAAAVVGAAAAVGSEAAPAVGGRAPDQSPLGPAASWPAAGAAASWPAAGGGRAHANAIDFTGPIPGPTDRGAVSTLLVWPGSAAEAASHGAPVLTAAGAAAWLDPHCRLIVAEPPASPGGEWRLVANWTASAAPPGSFVPCTPMQLDDGDVAYFADRFGSLVWGVDLSRAPGGDPEPAAWAPLRLPADPAWQPLTHHSLSAGAGLVWLPLRFTFGAVSIRAGDGAATRVEIPSHARTPPVLAGSVGLPAFSPGGADGGAVAFLVYGDGSAGGDPAIVALNSSGDVVWADTSTPAWATTRHDPVAVPVWRRAPASGGGGGGGGGGGDPDAYCLLILRQAAAGENPVTLLAVDATRGGPCLDWPPGGVTLPPPLGASAAAVGTAAAFPSPPPGGGPPVVHAYYLIGTSLVHMLIDGAGAVVNATADVAPAGSPPPDAPPVAVRGAWGPGRDGVVVGTAQGVVHVFAAGDVAAGPA